MKLFYYISALLFTGAFMMASCSQEEDLTGSDNEQAQGLQLIISDSGFHNVETRAIDEAYKTSFTDGDAIGIFAVKNGKVVEDINNRKFAMTDGIWELGDDGEVIEYKGTEFKKMKFYAYYPYNENMTIDPVAEDPFAKIVQKWEIGADQSGDNYTKYDLMTSVGEAEGQRLQGKIAFTMQHRMGLVLIKMPTLTYSFTNGGIDDYELPIAMGELTIDNVAGKPYYDKSTGTYRVLVHSGTKSVIAGTYSGVKEMVYKIESDLESGAAKQYTIKDESKISHTMVTGDYFCADGKIISKDTEEIPENCIGIVFYVGNPQPSVTNPNTYTETNDALRRDYPNCKHGLVIALNNSRVEDVDKNKFANAKAYFGNWFLTDEDWKDKFVKCETRVALGNDIPGFLGYNNTTLMEMSYGLGATEGCNNGWLYTNAYRTDVPIPVAASQWYIPSVIEMNEVTKLLNTAINPQIRAIGGEELISNEGSAVKGLFYWTSNERNDASMWGHKISGGPEVCNRERGSLSGYFRMMLAF